MTSWRNVKVELVLACRFSVKLGLMLNLLGRVWAGGDGKFQDLGGWQMFVSAARDDTYGRSGARSLSAICQRQQVPQHQLLNCRRPTASA